jgi:hypothetical protein
MTREEVIQKINDDVTSRSSENPSSAPLVGEVVDSVINYLQPYKKIIVDLEISGGSVTPTYIHDDFPGETKTWSNPSNGVIRCVGDADSTWNNSIKTRVPEFVFASGGTPYFAYPSLQLADAPLFRVDVNLKKFDNTQTGTPSTTLKSVEIRVYP